MVTRGLITCCSMSLNQPSGVSNTTLTRSSKCFPRVVFRTPLGLRTLSVVGLRRGFEQRDVFTSSQVGPQMAFDFLTVVFGWMWLPRIPGRVIALYAQGAVSKKG